MSNSVESGHGRLSRRQVLAGMGAAGIGIPLGAHGGVGLHVGANTAHAEEPGQVAAGPPHLERRGAATQLIVDGKPFLVLGGELNNSSSSSLDYMKPIWPKLTATHLNTVLAPVAWETIEPTEGKFDFSVVDGLISGARDSGLRLGLLWFGSWKNTYSSYVPAWVKSDTKRFPRVETSDGLGTERLSPFSTACRDADAAAFSRLMQHIGEIDGSRHTVIVVQVENESGVIPQSRDHSTVAEDAFAGRVPEALITYMTGHRSSLNPEFRAAWESAGAKTSGTWQEVFGKTDLTDDLFMAWAYATYIERVAAAGKSAYKLPMYANAALIRPNYLPGEYNCGGPLPHSMDIWKAGAPSLDFLSPDIYFDDFGTWAGMYVRDDNPLFVPEAAGGATGSANALYAYGHLRAIGFSPFGIDGGDPTLGATYAELALLAPGILQKQADGAVDTLIMEGSAQLEGRLRIGEYLATMNRIAGQSADSRMSAMFLQNGPNEFLVAGSGDSQITFTADTPGPPKVGVASIDEGTFQDGEFVPGRRLSGEVLSLHADDLTNGIIYRVVLVRSV